MGNIAPKTCEKEGFRRKAQSAGRIVAGMICDLLPFSPYLRRAETKQDDEPKLACIFRVAF